MRAVRPWFVKDRLLRALVPGAGSIAQARNELRWLKNEFRDPAALLRAVKLRGQSYPLQYILGTQPFGNLDIICEPSALIPRWETEEWALALAEELKASNQQIRLLDLCTGTGCILFLLCERLKELKIKGYGIDVSEQALAVFRKNQQALQQPVKITLHDLFMPLPSELRSCDVVVANPPYIKPASRDVERSVRRFEPSVALYEVPDIWPALVQRTMESDARLAVFEVGDREQIDQCCVLFEKFGWLAEGRRDSAGKWRTVWARSAK